MKYKTINRISLAIGICFFFLGLVVLGEGGTLVEETAFESQGLNESTIVAVVGIGIMVLSFLFCLFIVGINKEQDE